LSDAALLIQMRKSPPFSATYTVTLLTPLAVSRACHCTSKTGCPAGLSPSAVTASRVSGASASSVADNTALSTGGASSTRIRAWALTTCRRRPITDCP